MNVKRLSALLGLIMMITLTGVAQPTYTFNITSDTATESNTLVVAGYVKADVAPSSNDSLQIILKSGNPRPTHMDAVGRTVIYFAAGVDSMPFQIQLHDDTFVERSEVVIYSLRSNGTTALVGSDSILHFILLDNDSMPIITYVSDTDSFYLHDGFVQICQTVHNPNPFYIRYNTRSYDYWSGIGLTAYPGAHYNYYPDTIHVPPGDYTICQTFEIKPDTFTAQAYRTLMFGLLQIDPVSFVDSTLFIYIINDNIYYPPAVSFDIHNITIVKDTAVTLRIPITAVNNNFNTSLDYMVDTFQFSTTSAFHDAAAYHFALINPAFSHSRGTWHDTLTINLYDDNLILDTSTAVLRIKGAYLNTATDTLFTLTIIDTGALFISFKGAAFAHLKSDSIGYVQVFTSAPVKYDITADVTYLNGDAVRGVDFVWKDTTVTFPANAFDTISLPVLMLKNGIHDGNKQVNLRLSNVNPASTVYDITQYTYMIIDNDSMAVWPTGIVDADGDNAVKVYPNPFDNVINIQSAMSSYQALVINMLGETVQEAKGLSGDSRIMLTDAPAGTYVLRISDSDKSYVKLITKM